MAVRTPLEELQPFFGNQVKLHLAIEDDSGTGKTWGALRLAFGLVRHRERSPSLIPPAMRLCATAIPALSLLCRLWLLFPQIATVKQSASVKRPTNRLLSLTTFHRNGQQRVV
ncbi:MAG: hypothetical protein M3342_01880 [Bacteroidota bacterium]|nr:hypothetical protein [Bacteroidota bacterium]